MPYGPRPKNPIDRFLDGFAIGADDDCWPWLKASQGRYGCFWAGPRLGTVGAHRFMFELVNGAFADGKVVMHICDNPICVNPRHLVLGTQSDNIRDSYAKGRMVNNDGENHPMHKLTAMDVDAICHLHGLGFSQVKIANDLAINQSTVSRILSGKRWSHLTQEV